MSVGRSVRLSVRLRVMNNHFFQASAIANLCQVTFLIGVSRNREPVVQSEHGTNHNPYSEKLGENGEKLSFQLSAFLSVYISVSLSVSLSASYPSACLSFCLSVYLCLSVCLSICLSVCLIFYFRFFVFKTVCLQYVGLSVRLSVCLLSVSLCL